MRFLLKCCSLVRIIRSGLPVTKVGQSQFHKSLAWPKCISIASKTDQWKHSTSETENIRYDMPINCLLVETGRVNFQISIRRKTTFNILTLQSQIKLTTERICPIEKKWNRHNVF